MAFSHLPWLMGWWGGGPRSRKEEGAGGEERALGREDRDEEEEKAEGRQSWADPDQPALSLGTPWWQPLDLQGQSCARSALRTRVPVHPTFPGRTL